MHIYNISHIITGGINGDICIFKDLDDDDCKVYTVADQVHCLAYRNDSILAGINSNLVQSYTFEEGKPNGLITRFTAYPTHICLSEDKKTIAVASCDMTIKVHDTENFQDLEFNGHQAPVLSVAIDPKRDYLASSSCDGTVRIWNYRTQTMVRSFDLLPKSSDFDLSSTLCRLTWSKDGQYLFVPSDKEVKVYNRNTWKVDFSLTHSSIKKIASVVQLSPCGRYLALGCYDGRIVVWNVSNRSCLASEKHNKGMAVTGLAWHPKGKEEIAFVNKGGEFGTMIDFLKGNLESSAEDSTKEVGINLDVNKLNDEDSSEPVFPPPNLPEDDLDEGEISLAKIKSDLGFADDEEGTFLGVLKNEETDEVANRPLSTDVAHQVPAVVTPKFPEPQKPFQPGMSPEHLNDRYMIWNNTGIVRQYRSDEENSIEVEFHDSSVHHALHLNNHLGHSMAALNNEALVLASESQEDELSKLVVHHFSAWDGSKEWQTEMSEGEDILAVGIGIGWVAAATDLRNLRIFTTTGVQQHVFSIPGPVVCLAGFNKNIMVVYHNGIGVNGEQSLSVMILSTNSRKHPLTSSIPLSLSPKSFLSWAGFSDEGTPFTMDSAGVVRILNYKMGLTWIPVLHTKEHAKGKSDHYFLLGGSEVQGAIRCILCKGSRYPPVLPRPHVSLLELKIPLCEPSSEKSLLEEKAMRTKIVSDTITSLSKDGFDMEMQESESKKILKEAMVKLFALTCKADRESRGVEVCELMPSSDMVEVAVKYAARLHRMQLAERLNEIVQRKVEERFQEEREEREESEVYTRMLGKRSQSHIYDLSENDSNDSSSVSAHNIQSEESEEDLIKRNPLLAASHKQNIKDNPFDRFNLTPNTRNPFRKASNSSGTSKGIGVLDNIKISSKKEDFGPTVLKPLLKAPKARQKSSNVSKNVPTTDKENESSHKNDENIKEKTQNSISTPVKKTSALKLWLEDNKVLVSEKYPEASDSELLVKAALLFKDVDDSVKQKYKLMASEKSQNLVT
ncbi:WD repeat and HMG-box DNA-binding protein 1 [Armadillidium vulgare]|nr:WD repeat and HMG-box DNA-binding protein 1 [Armadillidium vulgare]